MSPDIARERLDNAEHLLLTAGAGLTAAAGINYTDRELFAREFPGMLQYGVGAQYEMIGQHVEDSQIFWGYWAAHVDLVRWRWPRSEPYPSLRRLADRFGNPDDRDAEVFVMTSNVDAMFERHGFDPEQIFIPQGDYALMQCEVPCTRNVWDWKDELDAITASTDPATQRLTDPALVPVCPYCGGPVFMNVRKDASFIDDHLLATGEQLGEWLRERSGGRGVVLEIGAGFNTPTVIRRPGEQIVRGLPDWTLIRINMDHADVPDDLADRAIGLSGDALTILSSLIDTDEES